MESTPFKLVITDNKAMADTIARTFGYTKDNEGSFCYDGDNIEVLWTGGELIDLVLKPTALPGKETLHMSAEEICRKYYNAVVRTERQQLRPIDRMRLEYIEKALSYCEEIVFICQPTDEGEKLAQAIKLFFNIKLRTHTVRLDVCNSREIEFVVEHDNYTDVLDQYRSDIAMRHIVRSDYYRKKMVKVDVEEVSPQAFAMLRFIDRQIKCSAFTDKVKKNMIIGGAMDIDRLFFAMSAKYDMIMDSMWDSLLWLYAEGLINNPMTRATRSLTKKILFGAAHGNNKFEFWSDDCFLKHIGAIRLTAPVRESLMGLPYDSENAPDDFMSRTSAIYAYIVDHSKCINGHLRSEEVQCPECVEGDHLPVTELIDFELGTTSHSVSNTLGCLLGELRNAGCVELHDGYITITSEGYDALEENA